MDATAHATTCRSGHSRTADAVLVGGSLLLTVLLAPFDAWAVLFAVGVHITVVRLVAAALRPATAAADRDVVPAGMSVYRS